MRIWSRGSLLAGVALAAALGAFALPAQAPAAAQPQRTTAVGVGAREFRLTPYRTRVPAGEVRFNLTNYGEDAHDLVVRNQSGRLLGRSAEVRAGGRTVLRVKLRRGSFRLSCDVADHAQRGMRATLRVVR